MITISNKTREELNKIIQKYEQPLSTLQNTDLYPYYAVVIDIAEPLLIKKDEIFNAHWKAIIILFVVKNIYEFNNQNDVEKFINDFEIYFRKEYKKYLKDSIIDDEFNRDFIFMKIFTDKRKKEKI